MADTTITSNANFTAAAGKYEGLVELWGPGGNGGTGTLGVRGGGGGGGGAYSASLVVFVPGTAKAVAVNAGADATFDSTIIVAKKGSNAVVGAGGAGGAAASGTGTTKRDGGAGGAGEIAVAGGGGGGGGSATSGAAGDAGAAGAGGAGGAGGGGQGAGADGGSGSPAIAGTSGSAPGGGGSGGGDGEVGGSGERGQCAITYTGYTYANTTTGLLGFVNVPLAASTTLSDIVAAPASGSAIVVTGWDLRVTGAAAPLAFTSGGSTIIQDRVPLAGNWRSSDGTFLRLTSATALNLLGGAANTRINGHINYRVVAV